MSPVTIGLVGCGSFAESHARAFRSLPQAKIVAVFDLDFLRAQEFARRFEIPAVCRSLSELTQREDLVAIDVVAAETAHASATIESLLAGKHVFVEKPMAIDVASCDAMIAAAAKAKRSLMVGHILRFEMRYALLKQNIEAGRFGRTVSFHARRNRPRWVLEKFAHVHPVLLTAIHDIDFLLWCNPSPVRCVRGYARKLPNSPQVDTFLGIIEFDNEVIAIVETHSLLPEQAGLAQDDAFQVVGERGVGKLQLAPGTLSFFTSDGPSIPDVGYEVPWFGETRGALHDELDYFIRCVLNGQAPTINRGLDGRRAVCVAQALIESSQTDRELRISDWK